jgi:hypothetical protein
MSYDGWLSTDPADLEPDWDGTRETEQAIEQVATDDAAAMAAIFRSELSVRPVWKVLRALACAMEEYAVHGPTGWFLSVDQFAAGFYADYGDKAILSVLASVVPAKETR